ncbi:EcsC family protein [Thiolinea disciformis]|uniref:EcsC family protein n=1 Tax=Thiolinea disciformis TaxID=125614 RepID=UPI000370707E|nr:EcsC family protein [Thiolinea disciformis]
MSEFVRVLTPKSKDWEDLKYAKELLENPGLIARMSNVLGTPIEKALSVLPKAAHDLISKATHYALESALDLSIASLASNPQSGKWQEASNWFHKTIAGVSGAAGGAFGMSALAIELPISTAIILRSIADIARSEGEDILSPEGRIACLEVFALGGASDSDNAAESGYFAVRAALAKSVTDAAHYVAANGAVQKTAQPLVRLITQIAQRFGVPVTQKAVAQSLPLIGAAGGALVNTLFIDHFQNVSRGHFIVRRLEREYGKEAVKTAYQQLPKKPLENH